MPTSQPSSLFLLPFAGISGKNTWSAPSSKGGRPRPHGLPSRQESRMFRNRMRVVEELFRAFP